MKKNIFILLIFILSAFCFANSEYESEIQNIFEIMEETQSDFLQSQGEDDSNLQEDVDSELNDLEESIEDAQNDLLNILNEDDGTLDSLDILQEGNDEFLQKNQEIEDVKNKIAQNKKQNESITCFTLGFNLPFTYFTQEKAFYKVFPWGVSLGMLSSYEKWSFKVNLSYDCLNKYLNDLISGSISLGRSPIHNYYLLIGYYFTLGLESGKNDTITNIGATGTIAFKFIGNSRLYVNIDALYRTSKESVNGLSSILNTFRINPSVGFVFGY